MSLVKASIGFTASTSVLTITMMLLSYTRGSGATPERLSHQARPSQAPCPAAETVMAPQLRSESAQVSPGWAPALEPS